MRLRRRQNRSQQQLHMPICRQHPQVHVAPVSRFRQMPLV
jgi:hypothetical protein